MWPRGLSIARQHRSAVTGGDLALFSVKHKRAIVGSQSQSQSPFHHENFCSALALSFFLQQEQLATFIDNNDPSSFAFDNHRFTLLPWQPRYDTLRTRLQKQRSKMVEITWTPAIGEVQASLGLPDRDGNVTPLHKRRLLASIDDEKYGWRAPFKPVIEIGAATLLPMHVQRAGDIRLAPIDKVIEQISPHHLRPVESGHLHNGKDWGGKDFDHAKDFDYGQSEWVSRKQIGPAMRKLLVKMSPSRPGVVIPRPYDHAGRCR